ncbi:proton-conducting membrane transporter [Photobacterium sanctipauli]|uniref:Proton-conducting membrane transporter n=3 Tax=Photobacterium sanctipauli TaxID=1342794 RepID=A0A2T3NPT6_9GAMM|nr:proton-conducting membrane transporter [Photobacterium sanctipauli]
MGFVLFPAVLFLTAISYYQPSPEGLRWSIPWVPSLDINLSLQLDALSFVFVGLISCIGFFVQLYALAYMKGKAERFSFHLYLTLFMLSMLGLVLSDNIILLFVFWELTTITSYLLIGFNHEKEKSRKNALQSLVVTGAGGLALLAGLILLGQIAGSYELSTIIDKAINDAQSVSEHAYFTPSLVLILLGAFTKSAQFPFHFWLPGAMAAPTPVSAFLHSATMVKAGIYLLARLSPVYAQSEVWFYSLIIVGGFTALWSAVIALMQKDLKLMLAFSTNTILGILTLLLGIGSETALAAAILFILAHAFYKASLFMVVGNIDKATGTRDIRLLYGLKAVLIFSFASGLIAALSKAGIPPLLGFLSKEYAYKAGLEVHSIVMLALVIINGVMVALALAVISRPFLNHTIKDNPTVKSIEAEVGFWIPPMVLACCSVVVPTLGLGWLNEYVLSTAIFEINQVDQSSPVKLWHGFNLPLLMSGVTLALGLLIYKYMSSLTQLLNKLLAPLPIATQVFEQCMSLMVKTATWQTQKLQQRRLSVYATLFFTVFAAILLLNPLKIPSDFLARILTVELYEFAIAFLLILSAIACVFSTSRLLSIAALGAIGFLMTLVFMIYSAPDVAKTLLLVETLMVVFVALLIRHLPHFSTVKQHGKRRRIFHAAIAGIIGLSITALLIAITDSPLHSPLADFFSQNSVPGGHGRNIVNVILVDFRAFDTMGEAIVVVIAAIAAISLFKTTSLQKNRIQSLIFGTTAHIVAVLMMVFSLYLLLRGHNSPGGGFIGALIAVIGLTLLIFAESPQYVRERLGYKPMNIALFGVFLSLLAGVIGFAMGEPFLTGIWWKQILPLGTPLIFDVGIYLAVIGGVLEVLLRVNEELD